MKIVHNASFIIRICSSWLSSCDTGIAKFEGIIPGMIGDDRGLGVTLNSQSLAVPMSQPVSQMEHVGMMKLAL
jgi:hypothetical protein